MEDKNTFNYAYFAEEQAEIENIKKKYMKKTESKMEKLRRLDESVYSKATMWSIIFGVVGALLMGTGMSLIMTNIGAAMGLSTVWCVVIGLILGVPGMAMIGIAYPVYNTVLRREREKIAPEILALADEIESGK